MADKGKSHPAACGYGLLGLCCVSCLQGPCRRSPFDPADGAGCCGNDGDWIVAHNLLERVALEGLQSMAALREALERPPGPGDRIAAGRREAMRTVLSPFPRQPCPLLEALYPEAAFPTLFALGLPQGSWLTGLLDGAAGLPPAKRDPEAMLTDALRLSATALAAEALTLELCGSTSETGDVALPDAPSPLLLLLSDEGGPRSEGRETLMAEIDAACGGKARICRLPRVALLPAFARRVHETWGIPLSLTGSIAVVFSSRITPGLGALALGFSLLPLPGYPIQGSPLAEKTLTRELQRRFGHAYLSRPHREAASEAILRSLRP